MLDSCGSRFRVIPRQRPGTPGHPTQIGQFSRRSPMATAQLPTPTLRWARTPFYFYSAATLIKIGREKATNLGELLEGRRACPDPSIFAHTFQTLREHH